MTTVVRKIRVSGPRRVAAHVRRCPESSKMPVAHVSKSSKLGASSKVAWRMPLSSEPLSVTKSKDDARFKMELERASVNEISRR